MTKKIKVRWRTSQFPDGIYRDKRIVVWMSATDEAGKRYSGNLDTDVFSPPTVFQVPDVEGDLTWSCGARQQHNAEIYYIAHPTVTGGLSQYRSGGVIYLDDWIIQSRT